MKDNLRLVWLVLEAWVNGHTQVVKSFPLQDEAVAYAQAAARENPGFRFWVQTAWEAKP